MAVKPNQVQAKQVFAYINDVPTRRVQSFDWASNFTIDSVFELGNDGLVEDAITLVDSNVTMNSNEWGTTDLEAQIFGIFESRPIYASTLVGATVENTTTSIYAAGRGAGGLWTTPATNDYLQIYRFNSQATTNECEYRRISGLTAASTLDGLRITFATALSGVPVAGDVVSLVNKYTITQTTVDSNPCHLVLPHRYSAAATTVMYSVLLPRCYVESLNYNFDTGGASEQNYSLVGEEERLVLNTYGEAQTIAGSFMAYDTTSGSTKGTLTFRIPLGSNASNGEPYAVYAGSKTVATAYITHTVGECTVLASFDIGLGFDTTTPIVYYFANSTKKGYKSLQNIDNSIGKLTKGYLEVWLKYGSGDDEQLQRCTGISINIPLTRSSIEEIGQSRSVAKPLEGLIRNEITLTFNRNDLREYAKLLGNETAFDAGTLSEILMTDLKSSKTNQITVKFYNSQSTHDANTLLKTMTFENCNFIGDSNTTPITGASGVEFNFSSQSINIEGSGNPPQY